MLELNQISKKYGSQIILQNFSLQIPDGSFTAITGASGSGKTTLLNILGGLEQPDSGTVRTDRTCLRTSRQRINFHRSDAGFLFQNFALMENKTVEQNLMIALAYRSTKNKRVAIGKALKAVGLSEIENKKIYQLSGGEQQRVALARLLLKSPRYVFADEPTGNLDKENRDVVFELLKSLHTSGKTIVMVTHDLTLANATCITQRVEL